MFKFIHTGDIHLGSKFKNSHFGGEIGSIRRREIWETFEKLIDKVKSENIEVLLIAGDLFENDSFTFKDFFRLKGLFERILSTKVVIISGNHDIVSNRSFYTTEKWPDNVIIIGENGLENIYFEDLNLNIYGFGWDKLTIKNTNLLSQIKIKENSTNILILHGDETEDYLNLNINEIKSLNFDYVALGHIHKPKFIYDNIAYCGSLEPLDISETGERGYIEGTIGDENTFKFIPFAKRKYIKKKIDISAEMNYFDVINLVKNDSENCNLDFLILEINGIRAKDFEINIIKEYLQREYFYVEIIDNTILDFDLRELKNKYENTLIQYYIDSFTEEELKEELFRKSLYIGLSTLLEGIE